MKTLVFIITTILSSSVFGQEIDIYNPKNYPVNLTFSQDTIKEIYVTISSIKGIKSSGFSETVDTTIYLDRNKIAAFVNDFNNNKFHLATFVYQPMQTWKSNKNHYALTIVSNNNISKYFKIQNNLFLFCVTLKDNKLTLMTSNDSDAEIVYKLKAKDILRKYHLTLEK